MSISKKLHSVHCVAFACHSPFGIRPEDFINGLRTGDSVLVEEDALCHLKDSYAGVTQKKKFRSYLKQRKAAKLLTPAAKLAVGSVGDALQELYVKFPKFMQSCTEVDTSLHENTGAFFAVGREPPDDGDAEETLLLSEREIREPSKDSCEKKLNVGNVDNYCLFFRIVSHKNMRAG